MAETNGSSRLDRIERIIENLSIKIDNLTVNIENLSVNIESLHSSVSELYGTAQEHGRAIDRHDEVLDKLLAETRQDAENIRALARIAEIHERRLSGLEGDESQ